MIIVKPLHRYWQKELQRIDKKEDLENENILA